MTANLDAIHDTLSDIRKRLDASETDLADDQINRIVDEVKSQILDDPEGPDGEVFRKLRFGAGEADPKLAGTTFARYGYNLSDIEFLHDLQLAARAAGRSDGPSEELSNAFDAVSQAVYMDDAEVQRIDRRAIDDLFPKVPQAWMAKESDRKLQAAGLHWATSEYQQALRDLEDGVETRALDSAESGYGSQLIGAQYVRELWPGARKLSRIFDRFGSFEMRDPTAYIPVEADIPEMLYVSESTSANASAYATTKTGSNRVTVSAKKFVLHQQWSGELGEDSIVPFVPFLRRQQQVSLAHYMDSLVLNGDDTNAGTGNINLDDADPADTKHYLAFDGVRHVGLVDNTGNSKDVGNAAITWNLLRRAPSRMLDTTYLHDWGHPVRPTDLVYLADPSTADEIALLDEVKGLEMIGPRTPLLTGQLAQIGPHPLISTIAMSKTEADGKVSTTAGNNTRGQIATVNVNGARVGWRRRVRVEVDREAKADQNLIILSLRMGFGRFSSTGAAAGQEWADVLYNIALP